MYMKNMNLRFDYRKFMRSLFLSASLALCAYVNHSAANNTYVENYSGGRVVEEIKANMDDDPEEERILWYRKSVNVPEWPYGPLHDVDYIVVLDEKDSQIIRKPVRLADPVALSEVNVMDINADGRNEIISEGVLVEYGEGSVIHINSGNGEILSKCYPDYSQDVRFIDVENDGCKEIVIVELGEANPENRERILNIYKWDGTHYLGLMPEYHYESRGKDLVKVYNRPGDFVEELNMYKHVSSPDGSQYAFIVNLCPGGAFGDLYVGDMPGPDAKMKRIVEYDASYFVWSPDGKQIAYTDAVIWEENKGDIWLINIDGSERRLLTNSDYITYHGSKEHRTPADKFVKYWAPDDKIIFEKESNWGTAQCPELWVINADGSDEMKIAGDSNIATRFLKASPDGSEIAYTVFYLNNTGKITKTDVGVVATDGTNKRTLGIQTKSTPNSMYGTEYENFLREMETKSTEVLGW